MGLVESHSEERFKERRILEEEIFSKSEDDEEYDVPRGLTRISPRTNLTVLTIDPDKLIRMEINGNNQDVLIGPSTMGGFELFLRPNQEATFSSTYGEITYRHVTDVSSND